jgi:hypothetical protein
MPDFSPAHVFSTGFFYGFMKVTPMWALAGKLSIRVLSVCYFPFAMAPSPIAARIGVRIDHRIGVDFSCFQRQLARLGRATS